MAILHNTINVADIMKAIPSQNLQSHLNGNFNNINPFSTDPELSWRSRERFQDFSFNGLQEKLYGRGPIEEIIYSFIRLWMKDGCQDVPFHWQFGGGWGNLEDDIPGMQYVGSAKMYGQVGEGDGFGHFEVKLPQGFFSLLDCTLFRWTRVTENFLRTFDDGISFVELLVTFRVNHPWDNSPRAFSEAIRIEDVKGDCSRCHFVVYSKDDVFNKNVKKYESFIRYGGMSGCLNPIILKKPRTKGDETLVLVPTKGGGIYKSVHRSKNMRSFMSGTDITKDERLVMEMAGMKDELWLDSEKMKPIMKLPNISPGEFKCDMMYIPKQQSRTCHLPKS